MQSRVCTRSNGNVLPQDEARIAEDDEDEVDPDGP